MSKWKDAFRKIAHSTESKFDELSNKLTYRFGMFDRIHAVVYHSYASEKVMYIRGRILEDKKIKEASNEDTLWKNLLNTYKRLESNEIPNALLEVSFGDIKVETKSDEEGYFAVDLVLPTPLTYNENGHRIRVKLLDFPTGSLVNAEGDEGRVFFPSTNAGFGIISDVDDTIMQTGATNLLKMAWATFMQNARTRIAFKGVSNFYKGLKQGKALNQSNPFFYVSSSPWNLFDLIRDFIDINDIPAGPLLLRDYGIDEHKLLVATHGQHKRQEINRLLETYPHLSFILIGDSGQEDTFIYHEVARDFPNRILAIYIRDAQVPSQEERVKEAIKKANSEGINMVLVPDSLVAARHAVSLGLMHVSHLEAIEQEIIDENQNDEEMDQALIDEDDSTE